MITDHLGYVVLNSPQYNIKSFGASPSNSDNYDQITDAFSSNYRNIILGDSEDETYYFSKPIVGASNKTYINNSNLKIANGYTLSLISDVFTNGNTIEYPNASDYFKVGQYILISDDNRLIEGGGNGKDRREGQPIIVTDITGDIITLSHTFVYDYLVSRNAIFGHAQTPFHFVDKTSFKIINNGTIDANKDNQIDLEPNSRDMDDKIGYLFGSAILCRNSTFWEIDGGEILNAGTTNLFIYACQDFIVRNCDIHDSHDKNLLVYGFSEEQNHRGKFINCKFRNSEFEDGITLYTQSYDIDIEDCFVENCGRYGFVSNATVARVNVKNITILNCGQAAIIENNSTVFTGDNYIQGTGRYSKVITKKASILIQNIDNGTLANIHVDQVNRDYELVRFINCNGWTLDNMLFEKTNDIALKFTNTEEASSHTLKNSTLRGNGTNYSLDANSTLIKENVIEE